MKQHWYKVEGHVLVIGGLSVRGHRPIAARCECGATSHPLKTVAGRRKWHRQHKAQVLESAAAVQMPLAPAAQIVPRGTPTGVQAKGRRG
jgi:hypothetical protein